MVDARGPTERTGTPAPEPAGGVGVTVPIALALGGLLLLVGLLLGFLLWRDDGEVLTPQRETTVGAIAQNPQEFMGERVTVSGEVSEILTPNAYILGGEQFVGGGELLVVGPPPAAGDIGADPALDENDVFPQDIVQISGEVREFNRAELEEEWNTEFPAEAFEGREGQPVLVGEAVTLTQRVRAEAGDIVEVSEVLDDPDSYMGEMVSVSGEITRVYSERVFVLSEGLIVVDTTDVLTETALVEGVTMEISGELGEFGQADFDGQDLSEYEGNPVLHAEVIQVLDAGE